MAKKIIGIIGAMESEVATLISALENHESKKIGFAVYHTGTLDGYPVVVAQSGIGKVNAAITAYEMIRGFSAAAVINTGVAGAVYEGLEPGDVVVATDLVQHDMDTSPIGDPVGYVSGIGKIRFDADPDLSERAVVAARGMGLNVERGTVVSGDQFIADNAKKKRFSELFGAYACEMEGAAIAHACTLLDVPFAVIRSISDKADGSSTVDFPTFAAKAAADNAALTRRVVAGL